MLDTETTGLCWPTDRIVSLAAVAVVPASGEVVYQQQWFFRPPFSVPSEAAAVHGLTTERLAGEATFMDQDEAIVAALAPWTKTCAAYNAGFDHRMLVMEFCFCGYPRDTYPAWLQTRENRPDWIDPLVWCRDWHRGKVRLEDMAAAYNIDVGKAHDSLSDAVTTATLLHLMVERLPDSIDDLRVKQALLTAKQQAGFQEWRSRKHAAAKAVVRGVGEGAGSEAGAGEDGG